MKTRNAGFSLIELIIAISILMILSGMVFWGINTAKGKHTEKSARELRNQIQLLRTVSMAEAGEWRLCLYEKDGEYYCIQERLTEESAGLIWTAASEKVKLGHKGTVLYELTQNLDHHTGDGEDLEREGQRGVGHQESGNQVDVRGGSSQGGAIIHIWKFNRDTGACTRGAGILEVSGSGRTMELAVYPENGRCEVRAKGQRP